MSCLFQLNLAIEESHIAFAIESSLAGMCLGKC